MTAPYLPLEKAGDILHAAVDDWDNTQAASEGWSIFNLGDDLTTGIERLDEDAVFPNDEAAQAMIQAQQTAYHQRAIEIHHAADSVRAHLWGADWVDSRCGPPR